MMIVKIKQIVDNNQLLKSLITQFNKQTNKKKTIKVPKVVKPKNKKTLLNFGDLCNIQPNVPSQPDLFLTLE